MYHGVKEILKVDKEKRKNLIYDFSTTATLVKKYKIYVLKYSIQEHAYPCFVIIRPSEVSEKFSKNFDATVCNFSGFKNTVLKKLHTIFPNIFFMS